MTAIAGRGTVYTAHVNATSTTMFVVSAAASTLVAPIALARGVVVVRGAVRGHLLKVWTVRAWSIAGMTLIAGGGIMMCCDTLERNGVLATAAIADAAVSAAGGPWQCAPLWIAGMACPLMAVAFRRGMVSQRDTEGLV